MKRLYVDSSVAVCLLLSEPDATLYHRITAQSGELMSSSLLEAEVLAAATREKVPDDVAEKVLQPISIIVPKRSLKNECQIILEKGYCRGGDLFHLATLLYVDPTLMEIEILTADQQQKEVARKVGIKVFQEG